MKSNTITKNAYVNIDTVNISMNIEDIINKRRYIKEKDEAMGKTIDAVANRLTNKQITHGEGFTTIAGKLKNYSVEITNTRVSMFGSLCKFYHGNNLVSLSLNDLKQALKMLAAESGLPIYHGNIVRIDLGINLITKEPIKKYLDQFEETPKWIRNEHKTQINFNKGNQSFTLYDKKQELYRYDQSAHHLVRDKNVLRIESRSLKQLSQTFKYEKPIKVAMLLSTTFRNKLLMKFITDYESLSTRREVSFLNASCVADIKNMIIYQGLEHVGSKKEFIKLINEIRKANNWAYSKTSTLRQWRERVIKKTCGIEETDFIKELSEMIALALLSSDLFNWK